MNIPTSLEAVAVIVILFIPGYVFLQFTKSAVAYIPQSVDARYFFALVTWGGLIHLSFYWWTQHPVAWYLDGTLNAHEWEVGLWAAVVLVIAPLLAGLIGSWVIKLKTVDVTLERIGLGYVSRTPSAWNYSAKLGLRWVRVHLKDGTIIAGIYGRYSFADDAEEKDLFLERVYNLDENGDFTDPVPDSAGVWIAHDQISHMLYYYLRIDRENGDAQGEHHSDINADT